MNQGRKKMKFVFNQIILYLVLLLISSIITPYQIVKAKYLINQYNNTNDIHYIADGFYYLRACTFKEILYADDYVFCMKTLLDSGQWNTLYYESKYGEKEDFSADNPELILKFLYWGFLLEYREEEYFTELAKYNSGPSMEASEILLSNVWTASMKRSRKRAEILYNRCVNGYLLCAQSEEELGPLTAYTHLALFCEGMERLDDYEKYQKIADELREDYFAKKMAEKNASEQQ